MCTRHPFNGTAHRYNWSVSLTLQHINPAASSLIKRMLHADPTQRPTIAELQADEFFTTGYVPLRLPTTCLTVPPRFSMGPSTAMELNQRRPLTAINNKGNGAVSNFPKRHLVFRLFRRRAAVFPDDYCCIYWSDFFFLFSALTEKVDVKDEPAQKWGPPPKKINIYICLDPYNPSVLRCNYPRQVAW